MGSWAIWCRAAAAAITALMGAAQAQSVQPMRFDLRPSGAESETTMKVENNRNYPITVEIVAESITLDEAGREVLAPAEDDFLLFPPQAIIEPGVTQSVRVRYIGAPNIKTSESYRVTVKQIPVDLSGEQRSGVALAFNFATLAGVIPVGAKPDVAVRAVERGEDGQGVFVLANEGDAYARAFGYDWTLKAGDAEHVLTSEDLTAMIDGVSGLIPPRGERRFTLALPDGFDPAVTTLILTPN